jgi:hypothetical protein
MSSGKMLKTDPGDLVLDPFATLFVPEFRYRP